MNLSPFQKEIIRKLRSGWELGRHRSYLGGNWHMQQGGIGSGGQGVLAIKSQSADFLMKNKLIETIEDDFPVVKYRLTELGKTINID